MLEPPEGSRSDQGNVWKLKKAIYGLKQAPKQWNETLGRVLQEMHFNKLRSDEAVFIRMGTNPCIIASYVDNDDDRSNTRHGSTKERGRFKSGWRCGRSSNGAGALGR